MKTEQVLTRKMGEFDVLQRISDSKFNATALLDQWNKSIPKDSKKRIDKFLGLSQVKEFMSELEQQIKVDKNTPFDYQLVITTRKKLKNHNGSVKNIHWMHPYLFIKLAMWLNPRFEVTVIKFVYDQLVDHRHDAGDNYKEFSAALSKFNPTTKDRSSVAKALNYVVFNKHDKELRNTANNKQMEDLKDLEKRYAYLINEEYIKSPKELISKLRKEWRSRYIPF